MKLQQVHLRINDAATGQPTPVRLRITDADGTYYAPYGRLTEFATGVNQDVGGNVMIGTKKWAYIDGTCEILLPPGTLHIEVAKGPEYKPIDEDVQLLAGKMALRLQIERWSDVRKQGWYSGDARVHHMTPDAALLEGEAEDLAVVNLLIEAIYNDVRQEVLSYPNVLSFSGQHYARHSPRCGVAVNTHNYNVGQGSLALLHCHRLVFPLRIDFENSDQWTFFDWCGQCHRKKGLVVLTEPETIAFGPPFGEPLADLILGEIDAFEISSCLEDDSRARVLDCYYRLCDAGFFVPLVGASEKKSNAECTGAMRTFALLPSGTEPSYSAWIEAIRIGRTFVTRGPLLNFTIDGQVPATTVSVVRSESPRRVRVEATSWASYDRLQFVCSGQVIKEAAPTPDPPHHALLDFDLPDSVSGWLAVRCVGEAGSESAEESRVIAHSSAIPILGDQTPNERHRSAGEFLLKLLNALHRSANTDGDTRLRGVLDEARTILAKKLSP